MDVYEAIYKRRSIRDFSDKKIENKIIKKIIDAGLQAPSNNHLREWEFILLEDIDQRKGFIDQLIKPQTNKTAKKVVDNWGLTDTVQRNMYIEAIPKQYKMLINTGLLMIPCFRQHEPLFSKKDIFSLNSFASIWCCIENILIAAVAEGIFGVTRIPFNHEVIKIKKLLNIPDDYEVPCFLALGYPTDNAVFHKQKEISVEDRIHVNRY